MQERPWNSTRILPRNRTVNVDSLLKKKQAWIQKKYEEIRNSRPVFNGNQILYHGKYYEVRTVTSNQTKPLLADGKLTLPMNGAKNPSEAIQTWMTTQTRKYTRRKVPAFSRRLGLRYRDLIVKRIGKWGYCTKNRDLVFSWQLSALPRELSDYVILHEITHLSEFNHSKNFRSKLASICPDYRERQVALRGIITNIPPALVSPSVPVIKARVKRAGPKVSRGGWAMERERTKIGRWRK